MKIFSILFLFLFSLLFTIPAKAQQGYRSPQQFDSILLKNDHTLVYFYADWCGVCKFMSPAIRSVEKKYTGKLTTVYINVDQSPELTAILQIPAVPVLHIYKKDSIRWAYAGFIKKSKIIKALNSEINAR